MGAVFEAVNRALARQRPVLAPLGGPKLSRVGEGAWVADRDLVYGRRARLPLRMVVLRVAPGELLLYAPVGLDDATLEALDGLGRVRYIVAPNRHHTLFVGTAMDVCAEAQLLLPAADAGLGDRFARRALRIEAPLALATGVELMPVRLRDGLDELVMYHDGSELLMVCDLLFNLQHASGVERLIMQLNGTWRRPAQSRLQKVFLLRDRDSLAAFYRWAMAKPFSQISMAHGQLITDGARESFYRLFRGYTA